MHGHGATVALYILVTIVTLVMSMGVVLVYVVTAGALAVLYF